MRYAAYRCINADCNNIQLEVFASTGRHVLDITCDRCGSALRHHPSGREPEDQHPDCRLPAGATGLLTAMCELHHVGAVPPLWFRPGIACRWCGRPLEGTTAGHVECPRCDHPMKPVLERAR